MRNIHGHVALVLGIREFDGRGGEGGRAEGRGGEGEMAGKLEEQKEHGSTVRHHQIGTDRFFNNLYLTCIGGAQASRWIMCTRSKQGCDALHTVR